MRSYILPMSSQTLENTLGNFIKFIFTYKRLIKTASYTILIEVPIARCKEN